MRRIKVQFIGFRTEDLPQKGENEQFRLRRVMDVPSSKDTRPVMASSRPEYMKTIAGEPNRGHWENISILDCNILFLNDVTTSSSDGPLNTKGSALGLPDDLQSDLDSFLSGGQVICIFLGLSNSFLLDKGARSLVSISQRRGETVVPNPDHWLKDVLGKREYGFHWSCTISKGSMISLEELQDVIAAMSDKRSRRDIFEEAGTTPAGQCVSCVIHRGKGKILLLPTPVRISSRLLRHLLDIIEERYFSEPVEAQQVTPPIWSGMHLIGDQPKILEQVKPLYDKFSSYMDKWTALEKDKEILWKNGKDLVIAVKSVLDKMGMRTLLREEEGLHDLEIAYKEFFGICEIKGHVGYAGVDDVRQLLDHYIEASRANPNVKGVFIVNHFKTKDPSERESGYSVDAIRLGTNNKFCLMTTWDLLKMYDKFLRGETELGSLIACLSMTNGALKGIAKQQQSS